MWLSPEKNKLVGAHLEKVRKSAGLTQAELARKLGKPQSFISSYEGGQRRIDILEYVAIVSAMDGDPRKLGAQLLAELAPTTSRKPQR